jgi:hypothetical protein
MQVIAEKRARRLTPSPEMLSKKSRTGTAPLNRDHFGLGPATHSSLWRRSIGGDNTYLFRDSTFTERFYAPLEHKVNFANNALPELSSFRPRAADPQGVPPLPVTPVRPSIRNSTPRECSPSPELAETPIFARTLHLVDTDVSIYKKDHGDEWRKNSLCLFCFRRHGNFTKLNEHGYEVCGHDEALKSHYWESQED